jgi:hypothetical protein
VAWKIPQQGSVLMPVDHETYNEHVAFELRYEIEQGFLLKSPAQTFLKTQAALGIYCIGSGGGPKGSVDLRMLVLDQLLFTVTVGFMNVKS